MTATNHALTGAAIALVVKKPELAVPLALLSHFALDLVPHYNPSGVNKQTFTTYADSWAKKVKSLSFRLIFASDMVLFATSLILVPLNAPTNVSVWTIFFSMVAGAAPDFIGGVEYIVVLLTGKKINNSLLANFHVGLQWMERPWGIYLEMVWFVGSLWIINTLSK